MGILANIKKFGLKDILSRQKQKQFTEAKVEEFTGIKLEATEVDSYVEQYIYRALTCPDCAAAGKCLVCECPFKDLQRTRSANCGNKDENEDPDPKWVDMMPAKDWKKYKKELGFSIESKIRYGE